MNDLEPSDGVDVESILVYWRGRRLTDPMLDSDDDGAQEPD